MKVRILRSTQADGGKSFDAGDTPDLSKADAHILIADGAAVPFVDKADAKIADGATESAARKPATGGKAAAAKAAPATPTA